MQFRAILTSISLLGGLLGSAGANAQAADAAPPRVATRADDSIVEMHQAFRKGDRKRLSALLPQARGHLLEPWAAYWELRVRLEEASPGEIQEFLNRYAGTYQEDRLRNDWLLLLGSRRDWAGFAAQLPAYRMNDDREVRCYALALQQAQAGTDVKAEVLRLWLAQREADEGCLYAASQLHAARKLGNAEVWHKLRLAVDANRVKLVRGVAENMMPKNLAPLLEVMDDPVRFLTRQSSAPVRATKELVVLALIRMAASEPDAAAAMLEERWSMHLSPEERSSAWGFIGKQAAQRLSNEAPAYFAKAADRELTDEQLGWKARAALRRGNWKVLLAATEAMGEGAQLDPTWVYWRARGTQALAGSDAQREAARKLFESIASVRGFYEQLALEELGQRISVPPRPEPLSAEERAAARANPGLTRALYAIGLGLRGEGEREWNYSTNLHERGGMNDRALLAAADLACEREVWKNCINTSERTRGLIDFEQRFPMPFKDAVLARATQVGLDPAYVYGLIRQESRFIMDARSGVGASGLMQVMPATARWTAKKIGMTDFTPQRITERDTNIAIGTGYLKLVLDDFAGSLALAAAAYNAGPGRPRNWRGQNGAPVLEAAIWMENVPFNETRDYVKKVLANTTSYAALISGQPQSLKARLGQIGPREAALPLANADLP